MQNMASATSPFSRARNYQTLQEACYLVIIQNQCVYWHSSSNVDHMKEMESQDEARSVLTR